MVKKQIGKICKYCIVKRKGHSEEFDENKVYASCYAACLSSHIDHKKAEKICENISKEIKTWAIKKREVDSSDISKKVVLAMRKHNKNAAFMYETHMDIA